MLLLRLGIVVLAAAGVILAAYIYRKKRRAQPLVCPLHADCETVVHSEFSSFFGIPVELLGLGYYGLISLVYLIAAMLGGLPAGPTSAIFALTAGAFLFSLYLTFIQAFTLRQWCSWCLGSAGLSTGIFALTLWLLSWENLLALLLQQRILLEAGQLLGLAVGLGGATISALLLLRFVRDFQISTFEAEVLRLISQVVWLALAVLTVTGVGIYLPEMARLNASPQFLLTLIVLFGLIAGSAFLTLSAQPRLISLKIQQTAYPGSRNPARLRRAAFAWGAVALVSWYCLFVLVVLPYVALSVTAGSLLYVAIVIAAWAASQMLEHTVARNSRVLRS